MTAPEDPSGEKLLEAIPGVTALVVAVSFALGTANLFGATFALGASASEFLSVSDLATATVRHSPIAILILGGMLALGLVLPPPTKPLKEAFPWGYYWTFVLSLFVCTVLFWTLRPSVAAGLIFVAYLPLFLSFMRITEHQIERGRVPSWTGILVLLMLLVGLGFLNSYSSTIRQVVGVGSRMPKATHTICIEDDCRPGLLVARLAETSVVRWVPEKALDYIPNNRIMRVTIAEPVVDRPIFNVWGWLRDAWRWAFNPEVTENPPPPVPLTSPPGQPGPASG